MVEVKSVKVDNWGVFFLQKLQNFFNKTDYCDLTLQFKDNSQLKVHRLVLSACTDFFNVLETRYNVTDDILVMPKDLQADVVVPIVNFMYTGTLEFEVNMYGRLLKTAKDMNMTVLLKLLEAHKRTVGDSIRSQQQPVVPVVLNKSANQRMNTYSRSAATSPSSGGSSAQRTYTSRRPTVTKITPLRSQGTLAGNKIKTEKNERGVEVRGSTVVRIPSTSYLRKNLPEPVQMVAKYASSSSNTVKGPSRFECSDDAAPEAFESSFDNISYESKPLITASQLIKEEKDGGYEGASTSFEKLKRSYIGTTKRSYSGGSLASPPEKKPNIQDVKEYSEAHRLREKIVAEEFEDDPDCFGDDFQNNDDDDDDYVVNESTTSLENASGGSVVIKGDNNSPVNHAKIISEVLKKYPHLVKNNKNIKLKIMQKGNNPVTVTSIQKDQPKQISSQSKVKSSPTTRSQVAASAAKTVVTSPPAAPPVAASQTNQPKKIDSRTMHALIAKGAENMTGPWLCLECGVNGRPISIPSYRGFRRHLINVHKQTIDPRLCEHCGWRSVKRIDLNYHNLTKHSIKPPSDIHFPKCALCTFVAMDQPALRKHKEDDHQTQSSQQHCIYCNKIFSKEIHLYAHMRSNHKERAQEDGVMDFSEDDLYEDDADKYVPNHPELVSHTQSSTVASTTTSDNKIKVLSNISLPSKSAFVIDASNILTSSDSISLEPSSEAEGLSNVASGIATSLAVLDTDVHMDENDASFNEGDDELHSNQYIEAAMANVHGEILSTKDKDDENNELETKFITEEGSELELTAAQKAELLEQLQGQSDGLTENVVMVLNDASFEQQTGDELINSSHGDDIVLVEAPATNEDVGAGGTEWQETSHKSEQDDETNDTSKDDPLVDENEDHEMNVSAENISADDDTQEDDGDEKKAKNSNNLISALEGDWTDEDEDAEDPTEKKSATAAEMTDTSKASTAATESDKKTKNTKKNVTAKPLPKIVDDSYDSSSSSSSKKGAQDAKGKSNDKNLTNLILDDWDSQQSEKFDEDDDDGDEAEDDKNEQDDDEDKSNIDADKTVDKEDVDDDADDENETKEIDEQKQEKGKTNESHNSEKKNQSSSKTATTTAPAASDETSESNGNNKKQSQKNELNTLINDWGDEDDEGF